MYYLDFFSLHRPTTKAERVQIRKELNRDEMMAYKLKLQRGKCFYCATEIDMASHLDHVIPVYYGGMNRKSNLVAACRDCNMTKMTGQIEITNPYTINDYLKLIEAKAKFDAKLRQGKAHMRYQPKRVQLYGVYHAKLFKHI